MNLQALPTYNPYRVLVDRVPMQRGFDVYALQCAMNEVLNIGGGGPSLDTDGILGPKTGKAIWDVQRKLALKPVDGKAGQQTQRAIALCLLAGCAASNFYLLGMGQLEHESSCLLGNYSAERADGSYDAGVTQQNTAHNDVAEAFNPVQAIAKLAAYTKNAYDSYADRDKFVGGDHSEDRRYALAAGHWNAPAYANWLAGVKPWAEPGPTARAAIEEYMRDAVIYL